MCETRDLGIKWPYWHTLTFEGDRKFDMRFVCPRDVKKMVVQRARSVYWKKWAAKHEHEELKEGAWLEPALALLRNKVKENWNDNHCNVARKIFLEGGWTDGWSDVSSYHACQMEEGTEKAEALPLSRMVRDQERDARGPSEGGSTRRERRRKEWKWQRGYRRAPSQ